MDPHNVKAPLQGTHGVAEVLPHGGEAGALQEEGGAVRVGVVRLREEEELGEVVVEDEEVLEDQGEEGPGDDEPAGGGRVRVLGQEAEAREEPGEEHGEEEGGDVAGGAVVDEVGCEGLRGRDLLEAGARGLDHGHGGGVDAHVLQPALQLVDGGVHRVHHLVPEGQQDVLSSLGRLG